MYADMDQWAEIRRRVLTEEIRKREACRLYDLHGLTLKKILTHEEPPGYRRVAPPRRPTIEPVLPIIRQILDDDATAPKKQRHTARRIWQRLKDEHGFAGGYTAVKDAVREMKVGRKEVFLPLSHPAGEGQVDYGFAEAVVAGVPTKIALFVMTLPYADAVFVRAYPRECSESVAAGPPRRGARTGRGSAPLGLNWGEGRAGPNHAGGSQRCGRPPRRERKSPHDRRPADRLPSGSRAALSPRPAPHFPSAVSSGVDAAQEWPEVTPRRDEP